MSKATCLLVFLVACAKGGAAQSDSGTQPPIDAKVYHDAHALTGDGPVTPHDAPVTPLPDAFVPKDAPDMGGEICSDNTGCGPGFCCWVIACIPGTPIGTNVCIPQ